jgi:hypothetical protein
MLMPMPELVVGFDKNGTTNLADYLLALLMAQKIPINDT